MGDWSIFLGIFIGYVVGNVIGRLFMFRAERQAITMAQIQALRLFSQSVVHYGHLRQWHDNVAIGMDEIKDKILKELQSGVAIEVDGEHQVLKIEHDKVNEISDFWYNSYKQELKSVWNNFEWDMKKFKDASVDLIAEASGAHPPPYEGWREAMSYLMMFEMALKQKEREEAQKNNSEEVKDETQNR
tara:strand:- start:944 stop:1504 length:561 start_codon:yes stop_codon:yes gene_type:complete